MSLVSPENLIVLAQTYDASSLSAADCENWEWALLADTPTDSPLLVGQVLYREASLFKTDGSAGVWTHLHLVYFRNFVPLSSSRAADVGLKPLRVELLTTSPNAFSGDPAAVNTNLSEGRVFSIEYINVRLDALSDYREIMRTSCGPATASMVRQGVMSAFHAFETIAVLEAAPGFAHRWNQIHLMDVDLATFDSYMRSFDEALRSVGPDYQQLFARLDEIRQLPRWAFTDIRGSAWSSQTGN